MCFEWTTIARTDSPEQTRRLARLLAPALAPGDVVLLSGDLGAGKTQFVQGVAEGLGADDVPVSPTFNIVLSYASGRMPLHHFDLYRLDDESQLDDIGLREYVDADGACFVEWAEKFPEAFDEHLSIDIVKTSENGRDVRVASAGKRAGELASHWREALGGLAHGSAASPADAAGAEDAEPAQEAFSHFTARAATPAEDGARPIGPDDRLVLAFDTANEVVALGLGVLEPEGKRVSLVAAREIAAHRASNTTLLPAVDELIAQAGASRDGISCICVGRGPGSFTGVRIAMATAKGIAQARGVPLVGVSTLDAIAWNAWLSGIRGELQVIADAMRKEVYPVRYALGGAGVARLNADRVVKAAAFADELVASAAGLRIAGDALVKYRDLFEPAGAVLSDKLWEVTGRGLLAALQAAWRAGDADPLDTARHDAVFALPVYTRLSDAEENERAKLAACGEKNLTSGVQDVAPDGGRGRKTMHALSPLGAPTDAAGVAYRPLDASHAGAVAALEHACMGSDAWGERLVLDELSQRNRSWWVAECDGELAGYAGGMVVDGDVQVLKVAVSPGWRRRGIARALIERVAEDARNLGASTCSLEVRVSNGGGRAFYEALGLDVVGKRPRYYSDREDAVIMRGPLPSASRDVAGMTLKHLGSADERAGLQDEAGHGESGEDSGVPGALHAAEHADGRSDARPGAGPCAHAGAHPGAHREGVRAGSTFAEPLILAIESSCDETAAAVVDGAGSLRSDVVASQVDFHARFGGVVPEIASRKHIEAICGVCAEALDVAGCGFADLDAVAATYAPGLLGALVVGVAYAKGVAWALDVPFIGVNHLEGHLYANKIGTCGFAPPAVVSLVSGGNTMLVHMRDWGDYATLGTTIDDAVGEAFDKVSKALGLGYPGGPVISRYAAQGDPDAIAFPRAMMHSHDLRFSLSGLKTAVVNYINGERDAGREPDVPDIAASFQQAVVDVQVAKAKTALEQTGARTFCLGGGVAANPALRAAYEELCAKMGVRLVMPPLASCGDNAGMIALAALDRYRAGRFFSLEADAAAHANLDEPY